MLGPFFLIYKINGSLIFFFLHFLLIGGYGDFYRDEGVHWGIQNGLHLSRSTIIYFKHNDMESLQSVLESVTHENKRTKKVRRYIIVEAVYQVFLLTAKVLNMVMGM